MKCPRDQHELKDRVVEEMRVHKCTDCFGIWVSKQALVELATAKQIQPLLDFIQSDHLPIMSLPSGKMRCPIDKTLMHFDIIHNIEIDLCPTCRGVWLDRGEFDTVAFRERLNWEAREKSEDNLLKIIFDTISYPSEIGRGSLLEDLILGDENRQKKLDR